jgi:hypothetical protein
MDTKSRAPLCIFLLLSGERPALGLAIDHTPANTQPEAVERLCAQRLKVTSLGEPRRLDPAVDLLFMVNPREINVKFYLC